MFLTGTDQLSSSDPEAQSQSVCNSTLGAALSLWAKFHLFLTSSLLLIIDFWSGVLQVTAARRGTNLKQQQLAARQNGTDN